MYEVLLEESSKLHACVGGGGAYMYERLRFQDRMRKDHTGREGVGSISVLSISSAVLIRTT